MRYFNLEGAEVTDPGLPSPAQDDCEYIDPTELTYVRIYEEGDEDFPWMIDGVDLSGKYTEDVRTFKTEDEAVACIPHFIKTQLHGWDGAQAGMDPRHG